VATPVSDGARSEINPRGWTLAQRAGGAALVRSHPLTVEGDKIGGFEVTLACGQRPGTYAVTYAETRLSPDDSDTTSVKRVDLWIEGKSSPLEIVASHLNGTPRELETIAKGIVDTDLLKFFAEGATDSMTVRTTSTASPGTLIRIGNTGFARAYPRLAAACDAQPTRVEAHAELPRTSADATDLGK
jgi:hypothetical protein